MGPEALAQVLRPIAGYVPVERRADLLVGLAEGDDAAVYRLDDDKALVFTVDFFTPVVDDPYDFGAVAAANALSDIYATGAEPLIALNIAAFPSDLPVETIEAIVRGGAEKAAEAGCAVVGGHTIVDPEPKYGMAVVGLARPDRLFLKSGLREGDWILLTKPLGTGAITTWAKNGEVDPRSLKAAIASMKILNRDPARVFMKHGVRACTDVTGFSFLGHAAELAEKSGLALELNLGALDFLPGAREAAALGFLPGGAERNRAYFGPRTAFADGIPELDRALLFSPETSGGLLAGVSDAELEACMAGLAEVGIRAVIAGRAVGARKDGILIRVSTDTSTKPKARHHLP
jgi:selenide,water dikinase